MLQSEEAGACAYSGDCNIFSAKRVLSFLDLYERKVVLQIIFRACSAQLLIVEVPFSCLVASSLGHKQIMPPLAIEIIERVVRRYVALY